MKPIIIIVALLFCVNAAYAQICGPASNVLSVLTGKYGEQTVFDGLSPSSDQYLVMMSPSRSWTMVRLTKRNGQEIACVLASGHEGETYALVTPEDEGEPI